MAVDKLESHTGRNRIAYTTQYPASLTEPDQKHNTVRSETRAGRLIHYYFFFIKCFIESAEQLYTNLYIILDLNIFVLTILAKFQSSQLHPLGETC